MSGESEGVEGASWGQKTSAVVVLTCMYSMATLQLKGERERGVGFNSSIP